MPEARGDRSRLSVVFLPAMLCDDELYRPQLEGLRDLIDPLVPLILNLIVTSWSQMPPLASDDKEDKITEALCRILRQNRTARDQEH